MTEYVCNWPVKEHGKTYAEGELINTDNADELLSLGAIRLAPESTAQKAQAQEPDNDKPSELEQLIAAIPQLDKDNDKHWIANGAPDAGALAEIVGFKVSADLRNQAWDAYQPTVNEGE